MNLFECEKAGVKGCNGKREEDAKMFVLHICCRLSLASSPYTRRDKWLLRNITSWSLKADTWNTYFLLTFFKSEIQKFMSQKLISMELVHRKKTLMRHYRISNMCWLWTQTDRSLTYTVGLVFSAQVLTIFCNNLTLHVVHLLTIYM